MLSVHIQENLEDELVKEALEKVSWSKMPFSIFSFFFFFITCSIFIILDEFVMVILNSGLSVCVLMYCLMYFD